MSGSSRTIGVIGGMGPYATVDFVQKILSYAKVACEQELPPILTMNDPRIPDRTSALLGEGVSPAPALCRAIHALRTAGATVLCMPCNTAHAFMSEMLPYVTDGEMVDMVEETAMYLARTFPSVRRVGVLCTDGTRQSALYDRRMKERGLHVMYPDADDQLRMMRALYGSHGIKAGFREEAQGELEAVAERLAGSGAEVIVMACTEIPLVLSKASVPLVDATDILARVVLSRATAA